MILDVIEIVFKVVVSIVLMWTGEVILYIFTFGRHSPRFDLYNDESPVKFASLTTLSFWIGSAFWVLIAAAAVYFIGRH